MTISSAEGRFSVEGRFLKNSLTQAAFNLIGAVLSGTVPSGGFGSIQIADAGGDEISTQPAVFSFAPVPSGIGCVITGQALFQSPDVTEEVHFLRLLDRQGNILAQAPLPAPLPASVGFIVRRQDTFGPV